MTAGDTSWFIDNACLFLRDVLGTETSPDESLRQPMTAGDTSWFIDNAGFFLSDVLGTDLRTDETSFSAPAHNKFGSSANFIILDRIYSCSKAYITKAVWHISVIKLSSGSVYSAVN